MKTNFILLAFILLTSGTAKVNAQIQKPWPYSECETHQYNCDSVGKVTGNIVLHQIKGYNYYGQEIYKLYVNKNQQTGGIDTGGIDSMKYDHKSRLLRNVKYNKQFDKLEKLTEETYNYLDSTNMNGVLRSFFYENILQNQSWSAVYKNRLGLDSFGIQGKGNIFHHQPGGRTYYFYSGKKPDSTISEVYDATIKQWKINNITIYSGQDTVTVTRLNASRAVQFITKYVYDNEGRVLFQDNSTSRTHYKYNKAGLLIDRKAFLYNKSQQKYLILYHVINQYDIYGATVYYLAKRYTDANGLFYNGDRILFNYTVRQPKKDSLAGTNNPDVPVTTFTKDTTTSVLSADAPQISFSMFPNPTQNQVSITLPNLQQSDVMLYSTDGKLALSKKIQAVQQQFNLDISGLKAGVYLLRIQSQDGLVYNKTLVKQP